MTAFDRDTLGFEVPKRRRIRRDALDHGRPAEQPGTSISGFPVRL
jgi:hypothetical protein